MKATHAYWPSLDGWRAIAVFMVILYHDHSYGSGLLGTGWFQAHGFAGVDIFFGISGFLICTRLLEEEKSLGQISLKSFYARRAFRILPPALCYLGVVAILGFFSIIPLMPKEWFAALLFGRNYSFLSATPGHLDWYTAHFWSLSLEEHFYLLLPGVLVFVPRRLRLPALSTMTGCVILWRFYRQLSHPWEHLLKHTDTRLDALLFPAILAIVCATPIGLQFLVQISRFWLLSAAAFFVVITYDPIPFLTPLAESVLIPVMILGTVLHPSAIATRFLEWPILRWLGKISYGLYLWQQILFSGHFVPGFRPLLYLNDFPVRWLALLAVATASYYLLEKPLIRLGHRIAPPNTHGRPYADPQSNPASTAS